MAGRILFGPQYGAEAAWITQSQCLAVVEADLDVIVPVQRSVDRHHPQTA